MLRLNPFTTLIGGANPRHSLNTVNLHLRRQTITVLGLIESVTAHIRRGRTLDTLATLSQHSLHPRRLQHLTNTRQVQLHIHILSHNPSALLTLHINLRTSIPTGHGVMPHHRRPVSLPHNTPNTPPATITGTLDRLLEKHRPMLIIRVTACRLILLRNGSIDGHVMEHSLDRLRPVFYLVAKIIDTNSRM
uniref:Uncharacterized protein n=1 Tax=Siphoviridae sp. ctkV91 TaxID=2827924 RepID=A0A8S5TE98_9CAUD|nr:MAG TPA: hypothetical protein [Siphoviridae sp. ctkV91]